MGVENVIKRAVRAVTGAGVLASVSGVPENAGAQTPKSNFPAINTSALFNTDGSLISEPRLARDVSFPITDYYYTSRGQGKTVDESNLTKVMAAFRLLKTPQEQYGAISSLKFFDDFTVKKGQKGLSADFLAGVWEDLHPLVKYLVNDSDREGMLRRTKIDAAPFSFTATHELQKTILAVYDLLPNDIPEESRAFESVKIGRNLLVQKLPITRNIVSKLYSQVETTMEALSKQNIAGGNFIGYENPELTSGRYWLFNNSSVKSFYQRNSADPRNQYKNVRPNSTETANLEKAYLEFTNAVTAIYTPGQSTTINLSGHGITYANGKSVFALASEKVKNAEGNIVVRPIDSPFAKLTPKDSVKLLSKRYDNPLILANALKHIEMININSCFPTNFMQEFSEEYELENDARVKAGKKTMPPILFLSSVEIDQLQIINDNGTDNEFITEVLTKSSTVAELRKNLLSTKFGKGTLNLIGAKGSGKRMQLGELQTEQLSNTIRS